MTKVKSEWWKDNWYWVARGMVGALFIISVTVLTCRGGKTRDAVQQKRVKEPSEQLKVIQDKNTNYQIQEQMQRN